MSRSALFSAAFGWLVLLITLLAREGHFRITTYSLPRYALIAGCLLASLIFFVGVTRFWDRLRQRVTFWTVFLCLSLIFLLPVPYVLYRSFGAGDWFPYGMSVAAVSIMLAVLLGLDRPDRLRVISRLAAVLFGIFFALLVLEAALRMTYVDDRYQVIEGNLRLAFAPQAGILPGVEGVSHYTTDEYGIRDDIPYNALDPQTYRILAIGGSTTENIYLDDLEAWHFLLQKLAIADGHEVWVGSVGKAGHRAANHFYVLRDFLPQFEIDMVLMMVGANDFALALRVPDQNPAQNRLSIQYALENRAAQQAILNQFYRVPYDLTENRTGIVVWDYFQREIAPRWWQDTTDLLVEDQAGQNYVERRNLWQQSPPTLDDLPANFPDAVATYRANLKLISAEARRQGVELVFINQPYVWSNELPKAFEQYLWFIQYGELERTLARYTIPIMAEGMAQFNAVLAEVCAEEGLTCVDLASSMNGDTRWFYDDVHFNEAGSQRVAELIWQTIKDRLPLQE